jgi:hypothetical protein
LSEAVGNRQRLAAILAADAAGYSRLMSQDDVATVASLDLWAVIARGAVFDPNHLSIKPAAS